MMCGYQGMHFGASYEDGVCIDGRLWDLDSCDEPGGPLHSGGDHACPACNTRAWLAEDLEDLTSTGSTMGHHWSGAMLWERRLACAWRANPDATRLALEEIGNVETIDFVNRSDLTQGDFKRIYTPKVSKLICGDGARVNVTCDIS